MAHDIDRDELEQLRDWSEEKLATGKEASWDWFQYLTLRDAIDAILSGMAADRIGDAPPPMGAKASLRLVADNTR